MEKPRIRVLIVPTTLTSLFAKQSIETYLSESYKKFMDQPLPLAESKTFNTSQWNYFIFQKK